MNLVKKMTFGEAVSTCFEKYRDFTGRASRREYWWFVLFQILISYPLTVLICPILIALGPLGIILVAVFCITLLLAAYSAGTRRLHDTGRSGWWQLLWLIPLLGPIILIWCLVSKGDSEENKYGYPPY